MLLKRRMSNEERGTENGERTREPESFDIIHSQFPSVLSRFHYHFHVPVPMTSLDHPSRFNGWSLCIPNFKISTLI